MSDIRLGVVGLGVMGGNHVRIAERMDGFEVVCGVDPAGDRNRLMVHRPVFTRFEEMLEVGVDAVVISVPPEHHEAVAISAAEAGLHTLVEKPLASDTKSAMRIRDAFAGTGLIAGVGHVERYNPAIRELKKRLARKELGRLLAIRTRRVGPFPLRVTGVGVVQDLATHDIDLLLHLGGGVEFLDAQMATRLGTQEDLLEAVGRLTEDVVVSMSVNWLTPMKQRSVAVLGERGAFHADLLSSDLTFYANADIPVEWDEMARLKGVSEGDMIRYAIRKVEPLQAELESFRDAILDVDGAELVTMEHGVEVVQIVDALRTEGRYQR